MQPDTGSDSAGGQGHGYGAGLSARPVPGQPLSSFPVVLGLVQLPSLWGYSEPVPHRSRLLFLSFKKSLFSCGCAGSSLLLRGFL